MLPIFFTLLLAMNAFGQSNCAVTLRVLNVDGTPANYEVDSFKYAGDQKEFADQFSKLRGRVPCQLFAYNFILKRIGVSEPVRRITRVEGRTWVTKAETWLTVSTDPSIFVTPDGQEGGFISAGYPMGFRYWKGRVLPVPLDRLWIHMRSVVPRSTAPAEVEAEVDPDGGFRVYEGVYPGPYMIYVTNPKGEIVHTELVRMTSILPDEELVISLPAQPPLQRLVK